MGHRGFHQVFPPDPALTYSIILDIKGKAGHLCSAHSWLIPGHLGKQALSFQMRHTTTAADPVVSGRR